MANGKFETEEGALIAIRKYRESQLFGKEGYLQGTRTLDVGTELREWNLDKILQGTIETSWEKIEAARQWGVTDTKSGQEIPYKQIITDIEKIRVEAGVTQAQMVEGYIKAQYGMTQPNKVIAKGARFARQTQFVGKLAFSPLTISRNILDRYAKGLTLGNLSSNWEASKQYPTVVNMWMESARKIEDQMIRHGAVLGHGHLSEGVTTAEGMLPLVAKPFGASERGNQTYIALVKKIQLEADVKRLMEHEGYGGKTSKVFDRMQTIVGNSQKQVKNRVLKNMTNDQLADAMSEGQIPDDLMSEILHRTTTDSAFPLTLASKRLWWGSNPALQVATQFKVWSADQTRFIYQDVLKYGIQTGDYSRLGRFILGTWLMGELYNISRDEIMNKDESVLSKLQGGTKTEIAMAIGKDMVDGGIVGMLADFTYGLGNWIAGPTVATVANAFSAPWEAKGPATLPQATRKFLRNDVPALKQAQGILDSADRRFFDKEDTNLTGDYARWKNRSFEFRKKNGENITDGWFYRSVKGRPQKRIAERSLSLEIISRQVLVGDYDDAAKHMKSIISQTKAEDIKKIVPSLTQSMRNNSPFGNMAKTDTMKFLTPYGPKERADGYELQIKWIKGYITAIEKAFADFDIKERTSEIKAFEEKMKPQIESWTKAAEELQDELNRRGSK